MATSKNDILDGVVKRVDDALASGQKLPWQKPWEPQYGAMSMPHNPVTGKMYSPGNTMILSIAAMDHGHEDPRYMTYKQARDAGWSVRKGEHAAAHIYAPITKMLDDEKTGTEQQKLVGYRGVALFNAAQIDGIPPMAIVPESERLPKTIELDAIAQQMGVGILHSGGMAFYRSSDDRIQLPPRDTFTDQHGYDATKAHELTHATGHPSRLNRDKQYQSIKGRAAEEMTAEIGAYLMSQRLGVPFLGNSPDQTDEQHAAYLAGWARDLTPEERRAAIDNGIKAATYMEKQLELARANGLIVEADRGQVVDHAMADHSPAMESGISPLPAGAAEVAMPRPDQSRDEPILRNVPEGLRPFMSNSQRMATEAGLRGEEKLFFSEKMREMKDLVDKMPVTYGTDGLGDTAPVTLHYYSGNADWYIMEKDIDHDGEGQLQAFGLADLGMGEPELGYINIRELVEHGAEIDYHFPPRTLLELKQEKYPELIRESLPEPVLSPDNASLVPEQPDIPGVRLPDFHKGDLITYVDPTGKAYDGIILKEADFSVGEDGKEGVSTRWQPVQINESKSDLEPHSHIIATYSVNGRINKDEFTRHIPNAVAGIDHIDPASRNYEKDIDRRRGLHAALEARVSHTLNGLDQPGKGNTLDSLPSAAQDHEPINMPPLSIRFAEGECYPFHSDAGHGWLEVPKSDLKVLDIAGGITPYSYQKGNKAYLEEDVDAPTFLRALEKTMGKDLRWEDVSRDVNDGDQSRIRNYAHYEAPLEKAKGLKVQPDNTASVSTTPAEWRAWKDQELAAAMERLGGYPAVLADPQKSLELQDMLDSALGERGVDIRNSLRDSGDWGPGSLGELVSDDAVLTTHATRVGAGANITQLHWHITMPELDPGGKPRVIDDLLDRSVDDMAAHITEQAMEMQRAHWRRLGVLPQKEVADRASLLPEEKVDPAEIQRGDHLVYRDGPGCIEDGFASAAHGSQITVIPMDRDKNGAIATWVMRPITVQQDQIIRHTASASMEAIDTLSTGNQRMTDKAFGGVRRAAYKALSKSAFVEMTAAQVIQDKPEIDKLNAERVSQRAKENAQRAVDEQKRLAGIRAEQASRIAEKESRFAEAFDGGPHALEDNKSYPLNPGDYVSYISPSGRGIDCIVRDKAALPADPTQRGEVIYQRVERGGLSGDGQYELGLAVAGDISKGSIMEHSRDFLPERAQIKKGNSPALDEALDKRMQQKREEDSPGKTAKARSAVRQKDLGLER
ncbi:MAG: zincin-like metallopeptidase domain-containing protein [Acidithiobacillus sp.]|nr:zincin-like metallopeptidase domain-containing protein [Acidithiobacillus sp.]